MKHLNRWDLQILCHLDLELNLTIQYEFIWEMM